MIKVLFFNPNMPPRAISLFNKINKDKRVTITGCFYSVSQKNRRWNLSNDEYEKPNFKYFILNSLSIGFGIKDYHNSFISLNLFKVLKKQMPDLIIIPGWSDINSFLVLIWAKIYQKKIILRSESTLREKSWRRSLFYFYIKYVCKKVDLIITSSNDANKFIKLMDVTTKTKTIYSSIDVESFIENMNEKNKKESRNDLNLKFDKVVYFSGQLIERKGIVKLLEAFSNIKLSNVGLVITGDGVLKNLVESYQSNNKNIYYFGYQKQHMLSNFYAAADAFILPSFEDTWGVVIIEAMAAGLPIIVSKFAGSSELIHRYGGGLVLNNVSKEEITRKVIGLFRSNYKKMGELNKKVASSLLTYENISSQFATQIKSLHHS